MATAKVILREDAPKKDRTCPLCLRVTINRRIKVFTLKYSIDPKHWNKESQKVTRSAGSKKYVKKLNDHIKSVKTKANTIFLQFDLQERPIDIGSFTKEYEGANKTDYFVYAYRILEIKDYKKGTIKVKSNRLNKLEQYCKDKQKYPLSLFQIDYSFILEWHGYLKRNYKTNTVNTHLNDLKAFLNMAKKEAIIKNNPFEYCDIKTTQELTTKEHLNCDEIDLLETMFWDDNSGLSRYNKNVLRYFLFSCFTGLRFGDIRDLDSSLILNDKIRTFTEKYHEQIYIPIINRAKVLIPPNSLGKIFQVKSNLMTNDHLKIIMRKAGINKHITFHNARHTFAVISLTLGIPIEVVSKLLGHSTVRVTEEFYAKIVNPVLDAAMEKWENVDPKHKKQVA